LRQHFPKSSRDFLIERKDPTEETLQNQLNHFHFPSVLGMVKNVLNHFLEGVLKQLQFVVKSFNVTD
jgi:hypothetical protein